MAKKYETLLIERNSKGEGKKGERVKARDDIYTGTYSKFRYWRNKYSKQMMKFEASQIQLEFEDSEPCIFRVSEKTKIVVS